MPLTKYTIQLYESGDERSSYIINAYGQNYEEAINEAKTFIAENGFWPINSSIENRMKSINVSHVTSDDTVIKSTSVMSGCGYDLSYGLAGVFGLVVSIGSVILEFFRNGIKSAFGLGFPMFILILLSLLLVNGIGIYKNRKPFTIHFIQQKDFSDISYIKKKYMILDVTEDFIAFTEKKNHNEWYSFKISRDIRDLYCITIEGEDENE